MECKNCLGSCVKRGKRNGRQVYCCKQCRKSQRSEYIRRRYSKETRQKVVELTVEGMGISSISRFLRIPKTSVCRIIRKEAEKVIQPTLVEVNQEYEIDELKTFVGSKKNECWVCYAIHRKSKRVVSFVVGRRTKENISKVVHTLLSLSPSRIYTDKLNIYPVLIPKDIHSTKFRHTNYIERNNLTLRTHLKRLSKKSICYSKSKSMLFACLRIYFGGVHSL